MRLINRVLFDEGYELARSSILKAHYHKHLCFKFLMFCPADLRQFVRHDALDGNTANMPGNHE